MQEKKNSIKQKTPSSGSVFKKNNWQIIVICLFIIALYGKTISYEFIGLDEPTLIIDNYAFIKDPSNIPQAFKQHIFKAKSHVEGAKDYYRPLLTVSFMIDALFSPDTGPKAKTFHLFNLFYHIIASVLLLVLLKKLNTPANVSFILTLLFASHPILAQAVAWIPGRNDSLIAIFALLSFIYFTNQLNSKNTNALVLHLLFFTCALFTKESAVGIIVICFIYTFIFYRDYFKTKHFLITLLAYAIIVTGWFVLRSEALKGAKNPITAEIIFNSLSENIPLYIQYLQKSILPFNLSVMSTVKDTNYILGIVALLLFGTLFYFSKKENRKYLFFGVLWFFVFITPSLIAKFFEGLEHRIYLPLIGIIVFISRTPLFENYSLTRNKFISYGLVLVFVIISFLRLPVFKNRLVYWESAIKHSENSSLACLNLGKTYEMMGRYNEAIAAYREGLKRDSTQKLLHNNIGGAYIYMKMYNEAEVEIKKELEKHPNNNFADYNLGLIKKLQGNREEAFVYFKKSVEKDTNFLQGYQQLADYYKSKNDTLNFETSVRKIKSLSR